MLTGYWGYNPTENKFQHTEYQPFSLFPTVVEPKKKVVYCRQCHRWEYIIRFSNNLLVSQCGKVYKGPFVLENTIIPYSYHIQKKNNSYSIQVNTQDTKITNHRNYENNYYLDMDKKILFKEGKSIFTDEDISKTLCEEITNGFIEEMGTAYKEKYGIKPTVSSGLKGFNLIVGYMLSPFNVNFYKISQHWGLNPYDKDFAALSSGDTPSAENEMFESLGIKPSKSIRKMYQKFPQSVICFSAVKDLGFTDNNIILKAGSSHVYAFFKHYMISFRTGEIHYPIRYALKTFVGDMLAISNEKTVWNSLERTIGFLIDDGLEDSIVADGICTYELVHQHLSEKEKKDVMHEGFNTYTHDFLVRRSHEINMMTSNRGSQVVNEHFQIEQKYLDLEYKAGSNFALQVNPKNGEQEYVKVEDEDRYCFYVAQDSFTLKTIGSEMHNCVGWAYVNSVQNGRCNIVYAMYKGKYRICIEVFPDFTIGQALGTHNTILQGDDLEAYHEWCNEKHIVTHKAFGTW